MPPTTRARPVSPSSSSASAASRGTSLLDGDARALGPAPRRGGCLGVRQDAPPDDVPHRRLGDAVLRRGRGARARPSGRVLAAAQGGGDPAVAARSRLRVDRDHLARSAFRPASVSSATASRPRTDVRRPSAPVRPRRGDLRREGREVHPLLGPRPWSPTSPSARSRWSTPGPSRHRGGPSRQVKGMNESRDASSAGHRCDAQRRRPVVVRLPTGTRRNGCGCSGPRAALRAGHPRLGLHPHGGVAQISDVTATILQRGGVREHRSEAAR